MYSNDDSKRLFVQEFNASMVSGSWDETQVEKERFLPCCCCCCLGLCEKDKYIGTRRTTTYTSLVSFLSPWCTLLSVYRQFFILYPITRPLDLSSLLPLRCFLAFLISLHAEIVGMSSTR